MRSLIRFVAVLSGVFTLFLMSPAQAHTELVSANPSANAALTEFPAEVTLTFSENLLLVGNDNPNKVEVFDNAGKLLSGTSTISGASVSAPSGITGNGEYTVKYHVAAQDGHVVEGSYSFTVQSDAAIASPMPISANPNQPEDGPNLLVRLAVLIPLAALATILLRKVRSSTEKRPQ